MCATCARHAENVYEVVACYVHLKQVTGARAGFDMYNFNMGVFKRTTFLYTCTFYVVNIKNKHVMLIIVKSEKK